LSNIEEIRSIKIKPVSLLYLEISKAINVSDHRKIALRSRTRIK